MILYIFDKILYCKGKDYGKRTDSHHTWYLILIKSYWVFIEPNREGKNVIIKGVCLLFLHTCKIRQTLGIVVLAKTWQSLFLYFKAYQVQAVKNILSCIYFLDTFHIYIWRLSLFFHRNIDLFLIYLRINTLPIYLDSYCVFGFPSG